MIDRIKTAQKEDPELRKIVEEVKSDRYEFRVADDGVLWVRQQLCVPTDEKLKNEIMREAHDTTFSAHPGRTRMYRELKKNFKWRNMKNNVAGYVAKCLVYQQMKTEHQRPAGTLQSLSILKWKWEHITLDFISGSPHSEEGRNSISVIVDRLPKSNHLLPIKCTCKLWQLAELFIKEIVRLHGVPVSIVSDKDP